MGKGNVDFKYISQPKKVSAITVKDYKEQTELVLVPITPVQWGEYVARDYGWTGEQWSCLQTLWNNESGWSPYAVNSSSGAAGIAQSLGHGEVKLGDAESQTKWGAQYIRDRYGNPCNALSFWLNHSPHYY